jgi:hypothetical protein
MSVLLYLHSLQTRWKQESPAETLWVRIRLLVQGAFVMKRRMKAYQAEQAQKEKVMRMFQTYVETPKPVTEGQAINKSC